MSEPGFTDSSFSLPASLRQARVAILGLGLMGGSLALALRGQCRELVGIEPDSITLALAQRMELANRLAAQPEGMLDDIDVIVLAMPVRAILRALGELPRLHTKHAVVIDLGSTKAEIMRAMAALPERFDPVGGHPMCGKERSSLFEAEASLYYGAPFALVALERTTQRARALAEELIQVTGAKPLWLDAETHDRWVAATSHLPYLLANALAAATPVETGPLVGPGFRSTSRVGATPSTIMVDVLSTNRENVLAALARLRAQLDLFEQYLVTNNLAGLEQALAAGADRRMRLTGLGDRGEPI